MPTQPNPKSAPTGDAAPYPRSLGALPDGVLRAGRFEARFARTGEELDRLLRLRFEVFNLELDEGLESSWATARDEDPFDAQCHHLLVEDTSTLRILGTYRLQTAQMAEAGMGFYSAAEYDLGGIPSSVMDSSVEIGRACIDRRHRNRQVLFLLWRGLARYMTWNDKRYFFGCSSLTSQDPREGWQLFEQLKERGTLHPSILLDVNPEFACKKPESGGYGETVEIPQLFKTYLRYGARVCSAPALDREFKTIDYLMLFDREAASARTVQIFFDQSTAPGFGRDPRSGGAAVT